MAKYILKQAAIFALINEANTYSNPIKKVIHRAAAIIEQITAEDVQPVRRGKWDGYICSECNVCADYFVSGDFYFDEKPDYCPNCGARMDGDTNV